jgi:hypothetical protein
MTILRKMIILRKEFTLYFQETGETHIGMWKITISEGVGSAQRTSITFAGRVEMCMRTWCLVALW